MQRKLPLPPVKITYEIHTELLFRGLPFDITAQQLVDFLLLHGYESEERYIQFCSHRGSFNGRVVLRWGGTVGEAFKAAQRLHGERIGKRYIEAFAVSREARCYSSAPSEKMDMFGQRN